MLACLNKFQKILQGILVRDFKKILNPPKISLRVHENGSIAYDVMGNSIRALKKQQIEKVKALWDQRLRAYADTIQAKI
ncbi:hypothetical protein NHP190002_07410 [Helicobacter ailurogastricus]|nr:hypothetical protein NHP190002_07410 [Helicobacter ailurogastricus]